MDGGSASLFHSGRLKPGGLICAERHQHLIESSGGAPFQELTADLVIELAKDDLSQYICVLAGCTVIFFKLAFASQIT